MSFRSFPIVAHVLAAAVALAMWPAPARCAPPATTLPSDPGLLGQFRDSTQYLLRLKLNSKVHTIAEVMETRAEKGLLVITPRFYTGAQIRLELDDLPGITSFLSSKADGGQVQLINFCPSADGFTTTNLENFGGSVHLAYTEITKANQLSCSLSQNMIRSAAGVVGASVSFNVSKTDRRGGPGATSGQYEGTSIEDLRRRNPAAEDDLRVFLSRVGQEHLLPADPVAAWQVFALDVEPTPQSVAEVNALVKALDADDFRARDDAVAKLRGLGPQGMLAIVHLDRKGLSLEQQFRLDSAMQSYLTLPAATAKARRDDPIFLLDCLMCGDPQIPPLALARLRQITGRQIELNLNAPLSERVKVLAGIRKDITVAAATRPVK